MFAGRGPQEDSQRYETRGELCDTYAQDFWPRIAFVALAPAAVSKLWPTISKQQSTT